MSGGTHSELQTYLEQLRSQAERESRPDGTEYAHSDTVGENNASTETTLVFPENFDQVAECITREDLFRNEGCDEGYAIRCWQKHALSEGVDQVGIYKQYKNEFNVLDGNGLPEQIQRSLSKVEELDRIIRHKESASWEKKIESEGEIDYLKQEFEADCAQYEHSYGAPPFGSRFTSFFKPLSVADEGSSCSTNPLKNQQRFFMTDALRTGTPVSSVVDESIQTSISHKSSAKGSTSGATTPYSKDFTMRNKSLERRKSQSSLTNKEEARVKILLCLNYDDKFIDGDLEVIKDKPLQHVASQSQQESLRDMHTFGGSDIVDQMQNIDKQLERFGILVQLQLESQNEELKFSQEMDTSDATHPSQDCNIIFQMAEERKSREKEKAINRALKRLTEAPFPVVVRDEMFFGELENTDFASQTLNERDIKRVVGEAKSDLEIDASPIAATDEIRALISKMELHLNQQVYI